MPRRLAFTFGAVALVLIGSTAASAPALDRSFVGPTRILLQDRDLVFTVVTKEWTSAQARHQDKLLRHKVRMAYWREHIPEDMRMVFDTLGYPIGRVIHTPVGHAEEWWYYGTLEPPLRFRNGVLIDGDRFEKLRSR